MVTVVIIYTINYYPSNVSDLDSSKRITPPPDLLNTDDDPYPIQVKYLYNKVCANDLSLFPKQEMF